MQEHAAQVGHLQPGFAAALLQPADLFAAGTHAGADLMDIGGRTTMFGEGKHAGDPLTICGNISSGKHQFGWM